MGLGMRKLLVMLVTFGMFAQAAQAQGPVNLLSVAQGARIATAPNPIWEMIVAGGDRTFIWAWVGQEVVFAFKDDKPVTFRKFEIEIPYEQVQNIREFELLVSDSEDDAAFKSLGRFTARNVVQENLYQGFMLGKITAKYFKFRVISNYGGPTQVQGNTQIFQIRLLPAL